MSIPGLRKRLLASALIVPLFIICVTGNGSSEDKNSLLGIIGPNVDPPMNNPLAELSGVSIDIEALLINVFPKPPSTMKARSSGTIACLRCSSYIRIVDYCLIISPEIYSDDAIQKAVVFKHDAV